MVLKGAQKLADAHNQKKNQEIQLAKHTSPLSLVYKDIVCIVKNCCMFKEHLLLHETRATF